MWIQLVGAAFFGMLAVLETTGLASTAFGGSWGPYVMTLACVVMLFEAWRTWRNRNDDETTKTEKEQPD